MFHDNVDLESKVERLWNFDNKGLGVPEVLHSDSEKRSLHYGMKMYKLYVNYTLHSMEG